MQAARPRRRTWSAWRAKSSRRSQSTWAGSSARWACGRAPQRGQSAVVAAPKLLAIRGSSDCIW